MTRLLFLAIALAALSADAFAQGDSGPGGRFRQLDANGDGVISKAETGNAPWFDRLDLDSDGTITLKEIRKRTPPPAPSTKPAEFPGEFSDEMPVSLESCRSAADYSAGANGHAVLVMVDGEVVYERYDNGWDRERPHRLASGTKSFAGVAAAAAVHDGLFEFDDKVSDTITEWKDDPLKSEITVRQLLSLRSGIEAGDNGSVLPYSEAIQAKGLHRPGTKFAYGPNPFQSFGEFMRRKLEEREQSYLDYLRERILEPIGMKTGEWRTTVDGDPHVPSGAFVTAREWAKFGEFVRCKGVWAGKPLVRGELLDELLIGSRQNPAYGMTFWLSPRSDAADAGPGRYKAAGKGKQSLTVIPSQKMVVVRFGETEGRQFVDSEFLGRLVKE